MKNSVVVTSIFALLTICGNAQIASPTFGWHYPEDIHFACRHPQRIATNQRIDLTPLFTWWTNAQDRFDPTWQTNKDRTSVSPYIISDLNPAARPLKSWVRIKGTVQGPRSYGWLIDAEVYDGPKNSNHLAIVLIHPPAQEKKNCEVWTAQYLQATHAKTSAENRIEYNRDEAEDHRDKANFFYSLANSVSDHTIHDDFTASGNGHMKVAASADARVANAVNDHHDASAVVRDLYPKLAALPPGEEYTVDWFAKYTGKTPDGLPIYDCGTVIGEPGIQ